ncbi:tRNA (N6-threonylcarbamoyladenosine(37)-N6)-methyltransferase TrmO [bacterium]
MTIHFNPIGVIHTPFKKPQGIPIQGALRPDKKGQVEIFPAFSEGLKDVDGFSHLILLYHFHQVDGYSLVSRPFLDDTPRGVFSIRGPRRPNPIGMTVVQLIKVENNILYVAGVDMVDGTPLLDIKPYLPDIDAHKATRLGWMGNKLRTIGKTKQADDRFFSKPD